jgi:hypothetical protein
MEGLFQTGILANIAGNPAASVYRGRSSRQGALSGETKKVYMKAKRMRAGMTALFVGAVLTLAGCNFLLGGDFETEQAGLFRVVQGKKIWEMIAGEITLTNCLGVIEREPITGPDVNEYEIVLVKDEEIIPRYLSPLGENDDGKNPFAHKMITLTARKRVTITVKEEKNSGPLLRLGTISADWPAGSDRNVTLILGPNITIKGSENNPYPLIQVIAGGVLHIQEGAEIIDNSRIPSGARFGGAGLEIDRGGQVVMYGGLISGHTLTSSNHESIGGGGIYLAQGGSFTMNGGVIRDNRVINNSLDPSNFALGGGISAHRGTLVMNEGLISENTASSSRGIALGGGIYLRSCDHILAGGSITGNTLTSPDSRSTGGGIFVDQKTPFVPPEGITIEGNMPDEYDSIVSAGSEDDEEDNTGNDGEAGGGTSAPGDDGGNAATGDGD